MPKVRLLHSSSVKGAEGQPGDIVNASQKQVDDWLASRGCVLLEGKAHDATPTPSEPAPSNIAATADSDEATAGNGSDADSTTADSDAEADAKPAPRKRKKAAVKK